MKTYIVGGWVRDRLLADEGRAPERGGDRDWVVVGATAQELLDRGFQAVGRDFPVFLHPQSREEYALARTERKTAPGYRGFVVHAAPQVTLEEDLQRRDLTINAMAMDEQGRLVDPHRGLADLRARVLRHVGPAFVEDPVRILRLARFAARFPDFRVAEETQALARAMVAGGETRSLVPERVWQEIARGLMETEPGRMFDVLRDVGLLAQLAPSLQLTPALLAALARAARARAPLAVRFAILVSGMGAPAEVRAWIERLRVDGDCQQLALLIVELRAALSDATGPGEMATIIERADALRRPARFAQLLEACALLDERDMSAWRAAAAAARGIDAGAIAARAGPDPGAIAQAVAQARRLAIGRVLGEAGADVPASPPRH